jgi:ubiquinone/menaquinone biosynthesis C-methylase UbiE
MNKFDICDEYFQKKLFHLLKKFFKNNVDKAINIVQKYKKINDKSVYTELFKLYTINPKKIETSSKYTNKLDHLKYLLKKYNNKKYKKMLDIGCEDCFQVKTIAKFFNIKDYSCINIDNWDNKSYGLSRLDCNFTIYDGVNIPYDNNSIDVIIIFQTLHHVQNLNEFINNVKRVLKKDGLLIIREHNCNKKYFNMLIDIEHELYEILFHENYSILDKFYSNYKNINEWDEIINLKRIYIKELDTATNSYYAIYKK